MARLAWGGDVDGEHVLRTPRKAGTGNVLRERKRGGKSIPFLLSNAPNGNNTKRFTSHQNMSAGTGGPWSAVDDRCWTAEANREEVGNGPGGNAYSSFAFIGVPGKTLLEPDWRHLE